MVNAGDGARGHLCCLGKGVRPPCVAACALGAVASVFGGLRWRGPFMGQEATSREISTRDVVVVSRFSGAPRWFFFDGAKFSEHSLLAEPRDAPLVGVISFAEPLDASSTIYLVYADGWLRLVDGAAAGGHAPFSTTTLRSVAGNAANGFVAVGSDGIARELSIKKDETLALGDRLFDASTACLCRGPSHLFFGTSGVVTGPDPPERWPEGPPFDERAHLYDQQKLDVKKEKGRTTVLAIGVDAAGTLRCRRLGANDEPTVATIDHATAGFATLGAGEAPPVRAPGVAICLHRVGPALALDALGCWVLAIITEEGDVLVYWRDERAAAWRRLKHDFIGRPSLHNELGPFALSAFDDVESRAGIFVAADRPAFILCERGAPSIVTLETVAAEDPPPETEGAAGFAPLTAARGFLLARRAASEKKANFFGAVCSGLGNVVLASPTAQLTVHKAPLDRAAPYRVRALGPPPEGVDASPTFACLCAAPRDPDAPRVVDAEAEPSTEPPLNNENWPVECLADARLGGVPPSRQSNRYEVRLVTGLGWRTTQRCVLNDGERGVCMDVCRLAKPGERGARATRATYVAVGTSICSGYGEDAPSRGRLLLLEVDYAPARRKSRSASGRGARAGYVARLRPSHALGLRGVVSGLAQVQEHLVLAIVNRVEVYALKGTGELVQIATHHAPHYVVALKVAKNYVLYADVYQSAQLLFWRDRDRQLWPLAKDADRDGMAADVAAADFVVDAGELAGAHALGIVLGDGDRVRLLQYAPLGSQSDRGGQKLLPRADFCVGVEVCSLARHRVVEPERRAAARGEPPPRTKAFAAVYGGPRTRVRAKRLRETRGRLSSGDFAFETPGASLWSFRRRSPSALVAAVPVRLAFSAAVSVRLDFSAAFPVRSGRGVLRPFGLFDGGPRSFGLFGDVPPSACAFRRRSRGRSAAGATGDRSQAATARSARCFPSTSASSGASGRCRAFWPTRCGTRPASTPRSTASRRRPRGRPFRPGGTVRLGRSGLARRQNSQELARYPRFARLEGVAMFGSPLRSPQARNVLDGQLLFAYVSLDRRLQEELARAVGTERAVALDNLLELDLSTSFL